MGKPEYCHARYLGGSTVVMPGLVGRPRCCKDHPENERPGEKEPGKPDPHATLERGDVILLDRYSAENREDFEVLDATPRKSRKKAAARTPRSKPVVTEQPSDDAPAEPAPQED